GFEAAVTRFENASRISTVMAGVIAAPATAFVGCWTKLKDAAVAGFTSTDGCWLIVTPPTVAVTVLLSATVDERVPVVTPLAFVGDTGLVTVFPVPVAANVTVLPLIPLPNWSRAVTVMVLWLEPEDAVTGLVAVTLVCAALTAPGTVKAVNVTGDPTPVACTSCVESTGLIAVPRVQCVEAIPPALVWEVAESSVPAPFSTDHEIATPGTGLLRASFTITERGTGRVTPTVSFWRSPPFAAICVAPPTCAVTVKVTGVGVPEIVAVAVVVSVPGEPPRVRVACACPVASVWFVVGDTEPPDCAAHVMLTLGTGLPFASVTRTSCGVASVVATGPTRLSPENLAMWAAAPTFAVSTNVRGDPVSPVEVADMLSGFAVVPSVHEPTVAMPDALVLGPAPVRLPLAPAEPGRAKVTPTLETGFPLWSVTITDGGVPTADPAVAAW